MAKKLEADLKSKGQLYGDNAQKTAQKTTTAPEPKQEERIRWTCYFKKADLAKVKDYAYTHRLTKIETMDKIIEEFFENHKEKLLHDPKGIN